MENKISFTSLGTGNPLLNLTRGKSNLGLVLSSNQLIVITQKGHHTAEDVDGLIDAIRVAFYRDCEACHRIGLPDIDENGNEFCAKCESGCLHRIV